MPHLVATLIYLSQIYSYYIRGDMSPLRHLRYFLSMNGRRVCYLGVKINKKSDIYVILYFDTLGPASLQEINLRDLKYLKKYISFLDI